MFFLFVLDDSYAVGNDWYRGPNTDLSMSFTNTYESGQSSRVDPHQFSNDQYPTRND